MRAAYSELATSLAVLHGQSVPIRGLYLHPANGRFVVLRTDQGEYALADCQILDHTFTLLANKNSCASSPTHGLQNISQLKVITKQKKYLGRVVDFFLDLTTFDLVSIVVTKKILGIPLKPDRIIPRSRILEITRQSIVVQNDVSLEDTRKNIVPEVSPAC